jgi:hypothetical protein
MKRFSISIFALTAVVFSIASAFTTKHKDPDMFRYRIYKAPLNTYSVSDVETPDVSSPEALTAFVTGNGFSQIQQTSTDAKLNLTTAIAPILSNTLFTYQDFCDNSVHDKVCFVQIHWRVNNTPSANLGSDEFGSSAGTDYVVGDYDDPNL